MKEVKNKSTNCVILSLYISQYSKASTFQVAQSPSRIFGIVYTYKYTSNGFLHGVNHCRNILCLALVGAGFLLHRAVRVAQGNQCLNSDTQAWCLNLSGMNMPTSNSLFIFTQKSAEIPIYFA